MSDGLKLASAILSTGSTPTLALIETESLIDSEVEVFEFIRRHFRTYRELPTVQTVQEETGIRLPIANEALQYYVDQVIERRCYNLIRDRFAQLRDGLAQRDMEVVAETVGVMQHDLRNRMSSRTGEAVGLDEAYTQVVDRIGRIRGYGGISGITTPWPRYDSITGGYQNADLITWVGRMGLGKTYVALKQAHHAHEDGENVLFVTTEMGIEQLGRRSAAISLGINPAFLKNGTISTYMERRLSAYCRDMAGAERFKFFAVGMRSKVDAIEALCQEFGPSIVFIDGVYLLRPSESMKNASRTERVAAVYDELKALTLDSNIPMCAFTQFNRAAGKGGKDGTLENIGFSDAVGMNSSVVVALKDGSIPKYSRKFDFLKGREGESGEVEINFKFAPLNMSEMSEEDRQGEDGEPAEQSVDWMR